MMKIKENIYLAIDNTIKPPDPKPPAGAMVAMSPAIKTKAIGKIAA